jgi:hypothetical protein
LRTVNKAELRFFESTKCCSSSKVAAVEKNEKFGGREIEAGSKEEGEAEEPVEGSLEGVGLAALEEERGEAGTPIVVPEAEDFPEMTLAPCTAECPEEIPVVPVLDPVVPAGAGPLAGFGAPPAGGADPGLVTWIPALESDLVLA